MTTERPIDSSTRPSSRRVTILRSVVVLTLLWFSTVATECSAPPTNVDPTGTGHETRIVVGITGRGDIKGNAFINDVSIGTLRTGETISKKLDPGTHTVRLTAVDQPNIVWPPVTVDLKEGVNYAVNFSAEFTVIRVTLGAECIGTVNQATVFIDGQSIGTITPGGFVSKEKPPGTYSVELRDGTKVISTQTVTINTYGATHSVNFGC